MTFFLLYKRRYVEKSFVLFFDHTVEVNGNQTVCLPTFFRCSADENLTGFSETRVNDVNDDRIFVFG